MCSGYMESSDGGTGAVDCSAGSIVWVRRRNGSWWPGKILGSDELSVSHLMSPRSGTPVKLLGREDASVDWYNLEKSKRVKAFRCGEFDECIERAEASQGMPPKKREKYARREDAILHALELEKQLLEKKYAKLGYSLNGESSKSSNDVEKQAGMFLEQLRYDSEKKSHPKSHQHSRESQPSLEEETNQPSLIHDDSDELPRMRGLQDFGLRTSSSKRKLSSSVFSNGSLNTTFLDGAQALPNGSSTMKQIDYAKSDTSFDNKGKIDEGLTDEFLIKRHDRCQPLVHVLQSSAKMPVPCLKPDGDIVSISVSGEEQLVVACHTRRSRSAHPIPGNSDYVDNKEILPIQMETSISEFEENNHPRYGVTSGENSSGSTEDTQTDSSEANTLESDTDEDLTSLSEDAASIELEPKYFGGSVASANRCITAEESHDLPLTEGVPHSSLTETKAVCMGMSKWQHKGKRKNRHFVKRSLDGSDKKVPRAPVNESKIDDKDNDRGNAEAPLKNHTLGCRPRVLDGNRCIIDWEDLIWNDQPSMKGYWKDSGEYIDPVFVDRHHFSGRIKPLLVDVDLTVKSTYPRERVPIISLMSKLNGQAIVGHPVQIEPLENGSSDTLLAEADECSSDILEKDATLPPVWRTARRTANFRVPRPHLSALDGDETAKQPQYVNQDRKVSFRKSNAGNSSHKMIMGKKSSPRPSIAKKPRKPPKKMSLSSTQKIRTLSSISSLNMGIDLRHNGNSYHVDGVIKPESVSTAVACIPVKLVFSRLNEALVGHH